MKTVICAGKNHEDSSLFFVAKTIQERVPGSLIVKSTSDKDLAHADLVINIDTNCTTALVRGKRFLHYDRLVVLLAGNLEENPLHEQLEMLGHAFNHTLVVHSKHSYNSVREFCTVWFSPAKARTLLSSIKCVPYGIEDSFVCSSTNSRDKWIVPYNRINQTQKNISKHYELTKIVSQILGAAEGAEVDMMFIASPNIMGQSVSLEKYPEYRFVLQPPTRQEYRELVSDRGMFLCTSNFESFGIYYLELMCMGAVGFFLDRPWIRELLPNYKYIASAQDFPQMVLEAYRNFDEAKSYVQTTVVPFIRKNYTLDSFVSGLVSV